MAGVTLVIACNLKCYCSNSMHNINDSLTKDRLPKDFVSRKIVY